MSGEESDSEEENQSFIDDNNNTIDRINNLSLVNVPVRAFMNSPQSSGVDKQFFYAIFDSDGLTLDYPT